MGLCVDQNNCDIVIPVYGQVDYTKACVDSIFAHTNGAFRLIIVDDASKEPETVAYLKDLQAREPERVCVFFLPQNQGYLKAANHGLAHTSAPFVVVMNNDTLVYPGWLSEMIAIAQKDPSIGIVNPQWVPARKFGDDHARFFHTCVLSHTGTYVETDWARGFCYLTKRCVIDAIGGLDPIFDPGYFDDWDYSMRASVAGYRCVLAMGAFVYHHKNVTYALCGDKDHISTLNKQRAPIFYRRWGKPLRLLVIDDNSAGDIQRKVLGLLRDQNRVVLITPRGVDLVHTALVVIKVPAWWQWAVVFYLLIDNARHAMEKRFNLVFAPQHWISIIKCLFRGYVVVNWSGREDDAVNKIIREMKYEGIGGGDAYRI